MLLKRAARLVITPWLAAPLLIVGVASPAIAATPCPSSVMGNYKYGGQYTPKTTAYDGVEGAISVDSITFPEAYYYSHEINYVDISD